MVRLRAVRQAVRRAHGIEQRRGPRALALPRRVTAGKLLRALRAFSLPASILPVLVATAAAAPPQSWRVDVLVASALGAALLHLGGNLLNDYFDFLSGVDSYGSVDRPFCAFGDKQEAPPPKRLRSSCEGGCLSCHPLGDKQECLSYHNTTDDKGRPGRLLVRGELLPVDVLVEALCCLMLAGVASAYLIGRCGIGLAWFLAGGLAGLYVYTGPPFRLKYRALGEPLVFVVFGPMLMAGAAWAQTGALQPQVLLLSIPVGLMTTSILIGNSLRDREEDAAAGILTLAHFADGRVARMAFLATPAIAALILVVMGLTGSGPLPLVFMPVGLALLIEPLQAVWSKRRLPDIDARTARFEAFMLVMILLVYVFCR